MPRQTNNFKNEYKKRAEKDNIFEKPRSMVKSDDLDDKRKDQYIKWITFWRRNPHRFIETYFGIKLFPYQILMIWVLQRSNLAYIVASRAAAKTWIIAVWSLTLAVLYPGIQIVVCAKTLKQGGIILSEKLKSLQSNYGNVAREIKSITTNANTYEAIFHNGSTIKVVPSSESSRGNRANYIVVEESRLVNKEILEQVIKPFLFTRMPPYRLKPEYSNDDRLKEEGIISYITSAWYTAEYWYSYVKTTVKRMLSGDETANFLAFDYLISIFHGIKTKEMIKNEMADNDAISVQTEYYNIPAGSSSKSYFKPNQFRQSIKRAFYPQKADNYNQKKNIHDIPRLDGEMRFLSVDIATRAGKSNDNTIISCIRAIPMMGKGHVRQLVYMESFKGINTNKQAERIKEIYYDFGADYIVLDLMNAGVSVFDSLSQATINDDRGITYPAFTVADFPEIIEEKLILELRERTLGVNPLPVIFPILANAPLNGQIATFFRSSLQKKMWEFLLPEGEAEEFLIKTNKEFVQYQDGSDNYVYYMSPYVQTRLLIGECVNLEMSIVSGNVKLIEKPGMFKDRYTSVSYGNWIISHFDKKLLKESTPVDDLDVLMGVTMFG